MDIFPQNEANGESLLTQACERFGVERRFWDIWGKQHEAPVAVQKAILHSLGVDVESAGGLRSSLQKRSQDEWARALPETIVVSQSAAAIDISIPSAYATAKAQLTLAFEAGGRAQIDFALADSPPIASQGDYIRKRLPLGSGLPLGYHRLQLTLSDSLTDQARLVVAPDRAYQPEWLDNGRAAGVAVSLYGVRSGRNWGCGDTTDLLHVIDWIADDLGASFVALNPLHAIPNRQPYNTSPYLPNSIFYRNHIYLDLEQVEEFRTSPCARKFLDSASIQAEISALREAPFVEYERVRRLKLRFLKLLFRQFLTREYRHGTDRARAFNTFVEREGNLLHQFAVHSALEEVQHKANPEVWSWRAWPPEYQDPDSPETRAFAETHWRSVLLHKYIQWQLDMQFEAAQTYARERGLSIGLYHDLALATDRFGSDLWAHRPFYADGCRVGSPPDNFSPKGQDWSFPPPNSARHFEDGYQLFAESIRKASAHGGALRIDHVMRFFRLYWIPDGSDATEGTYVRDRYEDLVRILALESVRGRFMVVGEDLGTVPDHVRETLQKFGILSYRLFYFERDSSGRFREPDEYPYQALVSAATHDLPTLAGFWQGADIDARRTAGVLGDEAAYVAALEQRTEDRQKMLDLLRKLALLPEWFPSQASATPQLTGELHNAIVGFLASAPSQLLAINQEDLFKDLDQQNLPGTTAEHPNWRHKMKYSVEELRSEEARGYSLMLRAWLANSGRLDPRAAHMK